MGDINAKVGIVSMVEVVSKWAVTGLLPDISPTDISPTDIWPNGHLAHRGTVSE